VYRPRLRSLEPAKKIDTHLDNLQRQSRPFYLVLVWVRNLKRLESQHSRTIVEGTLKALIKRFAASPEKKGSSAAGATISS
jgi:hypothetical protein